MSAAMTQFSYPKHPFQIFSRQAAGKNLKAAGFLAALEK